MQSIEQPQSVPTNKSRSNISSPRTRQSSTNSSSVPKKRFKGKRTRSRGTTPKPTVRRLPVLEYVANCCGVPAVKPALSKSTGDKKAAPGSLGSWRCGECKKRCKVTPHKPILMIASIKPIEETMLVNVSAPEVDSAS